MSTTYKVKLKEMLSRQEQLNMKINSQWRDENFPWYRAIWVECAELMEHTDWKWWTEKSTDIRQAHLELVDIWHFGLSALLQRNEDGMVRKTSDIIMEKDFPADNVIYSCCRTALEDFTLQTLLTKDFKLSSFLHLKNACNLSFNGLYKLYMGKNILNEFRIQNGYKTGSYFKIWKNGREDNDAMMDIIASLDADTPHFAARVWTGLTDKYN
jgi:dimeric dUTPase (all-alpha-NTP-PPase superfamily)